MAKSGCMTFLVIGIVASVMLQSTTAQTVHVVGDSLGWTVPVGNTDAYENWAANKTFTVGDILTFNFTTGSHDVVEVTKSAYDACTSTTTVGSIIATGPANVTLAFSGEHYYICTFASGAHCQNGQKLHITIVAAGPGTTVPPSQSPTSNGTAPPTATATPATPDGSSSSLVFASLFISGLSIAMSLFF